MNSKIAKCLPLIIFITLITSCNRATNYKNASINNVNGEYFIKLKGKRNLMVHDPISLILGKTYEDSILIPIPYLKDGAIKGKDIVFGEGEYKYSLDGNVFIDHKQLKVQLHDYDSVKKVTEQFVWNGEYYLTNR
jgi:hypothetical protein